MSKADLVGWVSLGIDVAKAKFDVALLQPEKLTRHSFAMDATGYAALASWVRQHGAVRGRAGPCGSMRAWKPRESTGQPWRSSSMRRATVSAWSTRRASRPTPRVDWRAPKRTALMRRSSPISVRRSSPCPGRHRLLKFASCRRWCAASRCCKRWRSRRAIDCRAVSHQRLSWPPSRQRLHSCGRR